MLLNTFKQREQMLCLRFSYKLKPLCSPWVGEQKQKEIECLCLGHNIYDSTSFFSFLL